MASMLPRWDCERRLSMQIILMNGYYIEIDPLNYTLKQKYKGTKKDGVTPRDGEMIR